MTITIRTPEGIEISGETQEETLQALQAFAAVSKAAPAAPAAPVPAGTVRVNPVTGRAAPNTTECGLCQQICMVPEQCYCVDFDVAGHVRKFGTAPRKGFGARKGEVFPSYLEVHQQKDCYAAPMTDAQHRGIPQRLIHNGYTVLDPAGVQIAQLGGSKGSPKRTVDNRLVGAVTEVPGGPNRTTADGFPMCRATYGPKSIKAGQLCETKVLAGGIAISGTCYRHQDGSFWEHLGAYAADPTTPPYNQDDLPETGTQQVAIGDEAKGAQTADTSSRLTQLKDILSGLTPEQIKALTT